MFTAAAGEREYECAIKIYGSLSKSTSATCCYHSRRYASYSRVFYRYFVRLPRENGEFLFTTRKVVAAACVYTYKLDWTSRRTGDFIMKKKKKINKNRLFVNNYNHYYSFVRSISDDFERKPDRPKAMISRPVVNARKYEKRARPRSN